MVAAEIMKHGPFSKEIEGGNGQPSNQQAKKKQNQELPLLRKKNQPNIQISS